MGSACSCASDGSSSDDGGTRTDKANGHVHENGPQNGHGGGGAKNVVVDISPQGKGDHAQNGRIKDDKNGLAGVTMILANEDKLNTKNIRIEEANFVTRGVEYDRGGTLDSLGTRSSETLPLDTPPTVPLTPVKAGEGEMSEEELVNIMAGELASLLSRLETAVDRLEKVGVSKPAASFGGGGGAAPAMLNAQAQEEECTVPYVLAYDDLLSGAFKTFVDCSEKIGGDVAIITKLVQETFINQRAFLVMTSKSQRPLDTELPTVLEPTGKKIQEVIAFRESKRQSIQFNHLSAVSESIPGLSWVAVTPAPGPYVKEMGDSAIFYTNRVLKEYREKDKLHVEWVQNWNSVFKDLQSYVLSHHTTGLSWNTRGGNAMANLRAAPPNCGVPPPPPPGNIPPPPPMVKLEPKAVAGSDDGRARLFDSINKGTDITQGLKKVDHQPRPPPRTGARTSQSVTDDMKTHKNPSLREGPKPFVKQSSPGVTQSPAKGGPPTQPPKLALEGKKWFVEYQQDNPNVIISQTRMDQCVYIFRCVNTIVQVKGKVNSVILDSCKKSSVVFDNLVSSAEVVNCQSCHVQVMGVMPILSIEKTDGCQVYLSKESLNTEIITAKSTEMNILIPRDDGEFTECAVPEQFKTVIKGLSLSTTCTEQAG